MKLRKIVSIVVENLKLSDSDKIDLIREFLKGDGDVAAENKEAAAASVKVVEDKQDEEHHEPAASLPQAEEEQETDTPTGNAEPDKAATENEMDPGQKELIDQIFGKGGEKKKISGARKQRAWQMRAEGMSVEDIAKEIGVTTRAVYVWLSDAPEKYKKASNARMTSPEAVPDTHKE